MLDLLRRFHEPKNAVQGITRIELCIEITFSFGFCPQPHLAYGSLSSQLQRVPLLVHMPNGRIQSRRILQKKGSKTPSLHIANFLLPVAMPDTNLYKKVIRRIPSIPSSAS